MWSATSSTASSAAGSRSCKITRSSTVTLRAMRSFLRFTGRRDAGRSLDVGAGRRPIRHPPRCAGRNCRTTARNDQGLTKPPSACSASRADAADLEICAGTEPQGAEASLPFTARRTLFNNTAKSAARTRSSCRSPTSRPWPGDQHLGQRRGDDGHRRRAATASRAPGVHRPAAGGVHADVAA